MEKIQKLQKLYQYRHFVEIKRCTRKTNFRKMRKGVFRSLHGLHLQSYIFRNFNFLVNIQNLASGKTLHYLKK